MTRDFVKAIRAYLAYIDRLRRDFHYPVDEMYFHEPIGEDDFNEFKGWYDKLPATEARILRRILTPHLTFKQAMAIKE